MQRDEEPILDLLGEGVLEAAGVAVGLVPRVAEHVGQEALHDAVAADRARASRRPAGGERDSR